MINWKKGLFVIQFRGNCARNFKSTFVVHNIRYAFFIFWNKEDYYFMIIIITVDFQQLEPFLFPMKVRVIGGQLYHHHHHHHHHYYSKEMKI